MFDKQIGQTLLNFSKRENISFRNFFQIPNITSAEKILTRTFRKRGCIL